LYELKIEWVKMIICIGFLNVAHKKLKGKEWFSSFKPKFKNLTCVYFRWIQ